MKCRILGLTSLSVLLPTAGCSAPSEAIPDGAEMVAEANMMRGLLEAWQPSHPGVSAMKLNLSDPDQARWLRQRLLYQGRTPETAPRLFALLEEGGRGDTRARRAGADDTAAEEEAMDCAHLLPITDEYSTTTSLRFDDTLLASCFGGADYVYGDIIAYLSDSSGSTIYTTLDAASGDELEGYTDTGDTGDTGDSEKVGVDFSSVEVSIKTGMKNNRSVYLESVFFAMDDESGETWLTVTTQTISTLIEWMTLDREHPMDLVVNPYTADDESVRVCLERTSVKGANMDCDYATIDKDGNLVDRFRNNKSMTPL